MERKVKFGVFSDAHVDIMHDIEQRLEVFIEACRKENVDFIVFDLHIWGFVFNN